MDGTRSRHRHPKTHAIHFCEWSVAYDPFRSCSSSSGKTIPGRGGIFTAEDPLSAQASHVDILGFAWICVLTDLPIAMGRGLAWIHAVWDKHLAIRTRHMVQSDGGTSAWDPTPGALPFWGRRCGCSLGTRPFPGWSGVF